MKDVSIQILKAEHIKDFQLKLFFSDQSDRVVNFEPFLSSARNPQVKQFLLEEKFLSFRIEYGDLIWGDYDLCFPIWDLYTGEIIKKPISETLD